LLRGFSQRGVRLLLWSGLGFVGFAQGNAMPVLDLVILPDPVP